MEPHLVYTTRWREPPHEPHTIPPFHRLVNPHFAAVRHVTLVVAEFCCGTPCQLPAQRWATWALERPTQRPNARARAAYTVGAKWQHTNPVKPRKHC